MVERVAPTLPPSMQNVSTPQPRLAPHWVAAVGAVASLFGLWSCMALLDADLQGAGWLLVLVFAPIAFGLVLLAVFFPLLWLLGRVQSHIARAGACLAPLVAFLVVHGTPNLFGLAVIGFVAASTYIHEKRKHNDARDREAFLDD